LNFDKQLFASLLSRAKGDRSINRFGSNSGVDPAYISRLLRCLINNSPSAAIIKKLADAACNGVTAQQLMTAAGYLNSENVPDNAIDHSNPSKWQDWEKVIEEAARYEIPAEMVFDLVSSVGKSLLKMRE